MRNEAKTHVIRTDKTVAELRDLNLAQQYELATDKMGLFTVTKDALEDYFRPRPDQKCYISVLLLDSHWDTSTQTITGHSALGSDSEHSDQLSKTPRGNKISRWPSLALTVSKVPVLSRGKGTQVYSA
ncbi:putative peptidase family domain containing protein [Elaphomyces granulatus]|jgi:hypothetical protein